MNIRLKAIILCITVLLTVLIMGITTLAQPQKAKSYSSDSVEQGYVLKDYNGSLAIFEIDSNSPLEILDVETNSLPERDIETLKKGLTAKTLNEIMAIVEDYE